MINNGVKLKAKIFEKGYNVENFASIIGMCATSFRLKLKGKVDFKLGETLDIKSKLSLTNKDYLDIFFGNKLEF